MGAVDPSRTGRRPTLGNRAFAVILRSPLSRLVDPAVMLLTVYGRRTGRPYTFPVQYARDGDVLWVYVGDGGKKTWWRNLEPEAPVRMLLRRQVRAGRGLALRPEDQRTAVEEGLRRYAERFPRTTRLMGVRAGDDASLARTAARTTMVRIRTSG